MGSLLAVISKAKRRRYPMAFQSRGGKDRQDSDRRDFLKVSAAGISSLFLLDRFPVCVPAAEKQKEPLVDQVRDAIKRGVQYLRDRERSNGECQCWTYDKKNSRIPDNSNTQYALLGLHAGQLAGAKIDKQVWKDIRDFYEHTQRADGGWPYNPTSSLETTLTMTTAGLCGLLIAGMETKEGREKIAADGTVTNCGQYDEARAVHRALQ